MFFALGATWKVYQKVVSMPEFVLSTVSFLTSNLHLVPAQSLAHPEGVKPSKVDHQGIG